MSVSADIHNLLQNLMDVSANAGSTSSVVLATLYLHYTIYLNIP
jgi:hypothetical protein